MTNIAIHLRVLPRIDARSGTVSAERFRPPRFRTEPQAVVGSVAAPVGREVRLHRLLAAIRALFVRVERPTTAMYYPNRYYFSDHAAMSREMHRL